MYRNILRKLPNDRLWLVVAVLLSAGFLILIFSRLAGTNLCSTYINSDKLYHPVIFRDIFIDGTGIRGWHLNAAPNFFPDMFFYFILMALTNNVLVSDFLFTMLQYLGFIMLVYWLYKQLFPGMAARYSTLFIYLMFLFLLIPVFENRLGITFQLLSISYHFGATIMALLSFNILIRYLMTRRRVWMVLLVSAVILGTANDRLYLVQFVFPAVVLAVLLFDRNNRKKLLVPLTAIVLSAVAGLYLFRGLVLLNSIHIIGTGFKMFNFDNISASWHNLLNHLKGLFLAYHAERSYILLMLLAFTCSVVYLLMRVKIIFRPGPEREMTPFYILVMFTVFIPVVLFMPVINGAYVGPAIIRFNFMALVMGAILLPLLLMTAERLFKKADPLIKAIIPLASIVFAGLFIYRVAVTDTVRGLEGYFDYYPKRARILDELKETHDLKYGVGNYWHAKKTMMYSRNDTRLYAVRDGLFTPSYHTTNENWYHAGGRGRHSDPVFNYMTLDGFRNTEKLETVFGNRIDTIFDDGDIIVVKLPEYRYEKVTREIYLLEPSPVRSRTK